MKPISYLLVLTLTLLLASCIRDQIADCPPLQVRIAVKDKNYFNVDKVDLETRVAENLPFREYVPSLYWVLRDFETGNVVDYQSLIDVESDNDNEILPLHIRTDLPHGKYILTVWGGMSSEGALGDDPTTFNLHRNNAELNDVYLTNDTIVFDPFNFDYIVELERIKGKLIIEGVNIPDDITKTQEYVTGLYSYVNNSFFYSDNISVGKTSDIDMSKVSEEGSLIVNTAVLSPSAVANASVLTMSFQHGVESRSSTYTAPDINININRNELTVVRYEWDEEEDDFRIYLLVNGNWEQISQMELD